MELSVWSGIPPSGQGQRQLLCLTSLWCGVQYSCSHHCHWLLSTDGRLQDMGPIQKGSKLSGLPLTFGVIEGVHYGCRDCIVIFVILHREVCMQTHSEIPFKVCWGGVVLFFKSCPSIDSFVSVWFWVFVFVWATGWYTVSQQAAVHGIL